MDNDYPVVEQATAAPGELRNVIFVSPWLEMVHTCGAVRNVRTDVGWWVEECDLPFGHRGAHGRG